MTHIDILCLLTSISCHFTSLTLLLSFYSPSMIILFRSFNTPIDLGVCSDTP